MEALRELLGEKFADDRRRRKRPKAVKVVLSLVLRQEHKLAINAHVIVPVLNYVYSQLRRKKDEKNDDDAFLDDDLKVLLCVLTGDSLSGWNVRKREESSWRRWKRTVTRRVIKRRIG